MSSQKYGRQPNKCGRSAQWRCRCQSNCKSYLASRPVRQYTRIGVGARDLMSANLWTTWRSDVTPGIASKLIPAKRTATSRLDSVLSIHSPPMLTLPGNKLQAFATTVVVVVVNYLNSPLSKSSPDIITCHCQFHYQHAITIIINVVIIIVTRHYEMPFPL